MIPARGVPYSVTVVIPATQWCLISLENMCMCMHGYALRYIYHVLIFAHYCPHTDISYQYTELRPVEGDSEGEEEATLELTLDYSDNDGDDDTYPPPAKKPTFESVKREEERYGMTSSLFSIRKHV